MRPWYRNIDWRELVASYGTYVVLAAFIVVLVEEVGTQFLNGVNLTNIVTQSSFIGIIALGQTFILITAGIDLSVGSMLSLAGIVAATMVNLPGSSLITVFVVVLGIGAVWGALQATLIVYARIMPFLVTLAGLTVLQGLTLMLTSGQPVNIPLSKTWFLDIGKDSVLGLPLPAAFFLGWAVLTFIVLKFTPFGRHVYAIGSNEEAALAMGIQVGRIKYAIYMLSGVMAAFAGIILTAWVNGADPLAGKGYELISISGAVIGGTDLFGGIGGIGGTVLGVLFLGVVNNGLNLLAVNAYLQEMADGLVLLLAVVLQRLRKL